jgi:hypothetical protein
LGLGNHWGRGEGVTGGEVRESLEEKLGNHWRRGELFTLGEVRESLLFQYIPFSLQTSMSAKIHLRFVAATPVASTPLGASTASVNLGSDSLILCT